MAMAEVRLFNINKDDENVGMSQEERAQKAMRDPKIQEILSDPVMQQILQQMSTDPAAAREYFLIWCLR